MWSRNKEKSSTAVCAVFVQLCLPKVLGWRLFSGELEPLLAFQMTMYEASFVAVTSLRTRTSPRGEWADGYFVPITRIISREG